MSSDIEPQTSSQTSGTLSASRGNPQPERPLQHEEGRWLFDFNNFYYFVCVCFFCSCAAPHFHSWTASEQLCMTQKIILTSLSGTRCFSSSPFEGGCQSQIDGLAEKMCHAFEMSGGSTHSPSPVSRVSGMPCARCVLALRTSLAETKKIRPAASSRPTTFSSSARNPTQRSRCCFLTWTAGGAVRFYHSIHIYSAGE